GVHLLTNGTATITNTTIKNNTAYTPNQSQVPFQHSSMILVDVQGGAITGTTGASGTFGNSSNNGINSPTPSPFTSSNPVTPADFTAANNGGGNISIGTGVSVPIWSDFNLKTPEPSPRNRGAVNP